MTEKLEDKEEERRRLLARVISAQEEERKRIARELHDEASQALTSLMLGLKHLEEHSGEKPLQCKAAELRLLVGDTLDLMHDLALELRPTALDDLGLVAALERYVRDYAHKHGINVDFHGGSLKGGRLPPQEETTLYCIVQEALANVVKHADARNVSILLEQRDNTAVVIVEDDGKGFDLEAVMRAGLRLLLNGQADMDVVGEAGDGWDTVITTSGTHNVVNRRGATYGTDSDLTILTCDDHSQGSAKDRSVFSQSDKVFDLDYDIKCGGTPTAIDISIGGI